MTLGNVDLRSRGASRLETLPVAGRDLYPTSTVRCTGRPAAQARGAGANQDFPAGRRTAGFQLHRFLGHALGKWLRTAELEGTTRKSYSSYIERAIKPAPGEIVLPKVDAPTFGILHTEVRVGAG
jgi:hypothetical protein